MKKTLSLFLAALMIFTSLFAMSFNSFAADNSNNVLALVTDKTGYNKGDTATARVVVNASQISGLGIVLRYDSDAYTVEAADCMDGLSLVSTAQKGAVKFSWVSANDTDFYNKVVFTVKFTVLTNDADDFTLEFYSDNVIGPNNEDISSTFTIERRLFPDVPLKEWYSAAVAFNVEKGYFKGYANGYFGPADNIQRQDFVVVLAKIANADLSAYEGQNGDFDDVPANDYYSAAIAWAKDNKILSGYADGRFGVGDPITREQACVIFYNYCHGSVSGDVNTVLADYPDGSAVSDWARTAVAWAAENHVVGGNGKLNPVGNANRAEMAQIIMNMSNNNIL